MNPKEKEKPEEIKVTLTLEKFKPDSLFLRQAVGDGTFPDGRSFEISLGMGGGNIVRIDDGPWYILSVKNLVEAIGKLEE